MFILDRYDNLKKCSARYKLISEILPYANHDIISFEDV
jgi:hypothetical protein